METRNIFIDTQAFMQQGLNFENKILSRIGALAKARLINVYISEVVKKEVESKIRERLSKSAQGRASMLRDLAFLESAFPHDLKDALAANTNESLKKSALEKWDAFIENANVNVIDPNRICNVELLSYYFSGEFPFSSGKKKNEFPDAISLLSLMKWLQESGDRAYVISDDKDFQGFCDNNEKCISLGQLSEFLDIYNRAEERLTNVVHQYLENEIDWVEDVIKNAFCECGFVFEDNYDADVDNVVIQKFAIEEIDVIEVEDGRAALDLAVAITCTADVSGPDYETAVWDSEDKEFIFIENFDTNMEFEDVYDVSVEVIFDEEQGEITGIPVVEFNRGSDIGFSFDDGFPYK